MGAPTPPVTGLSVLAVSPATDWPGLTRELAAAPLPCVTVLVSDEPLPAAAAPALEQADLTLAPDGPGRLTVPAGPGDLDRITEACERFPGATTTLTGLLRLGEHLDVAGGITAEAHAYSALLAGPEHASWLRARKPRRRRADNEDAVILRREDDVLHLTLNRPEVHNAFGRALRDQLVNALDLALLDDSVRSVVLRGAGPSFCSGGDLAEFGTTPDVITAMTVRISQSVGRRIARLGTRATAHLHGACLGAGIELPAFANTVTADRDARFQLPEIAMGLIPGAGGTMSIPRRIGRARTAWLALTGHHIDAKLAHAWGLVDELT
ncbi:enoyl-CoA hydratase/isomerase family protein [Amycolatopsis rhabdoformis]|uniref:Enoyl-CoA hydratase/isomerase family protein n=1 Tax=Amycolatopsis rhabdoformis TaxID=1448059 RepID=A0ABZ1IDU0_9PSEU|nr:enoyl-CoA hydratase/isomerase family protein [Amycolatopsis rhabdoformis]WSE32592.1 enoyl-CoA hydratase/isomerase family protein [Amycolatopsis rhabdoformis]